MLHLRPGDVFASDYRIEQPLAMGGMGAVYVAQQLSTGRKRALKLMLPALVDNPRTRERFEQEARVASQIASDHVVEVVAAGIDAASGAPWLAMELLEGETLSTRVARLGCLAPDETLEVFRQMCHALGAAHASGLVHRDIKPDNLYLATPRREGVPFTLKILDFGIAKLTEDVRSTGDATRGVGSPLWMAPEQTAAGAVQPTVDVWALGLVAFYCLTGRVYWRSGNADEATLSELMREVVIDPVEAASVRALQLGVPHRLPAGFDGWFARTVVRPREQRYPDASAALAGLSAALSGGGAELATWAGTPAMTGVPHHRESLPGAGVPVRPAQSGTGRWLLLGGFLLGALGLLGVLAFVALGAGYYLTSQPEEPLADAPLQPSAEVPAIPAAPDAGGTAPADTAAQVALGPKASQRKVASAPPLETTAKGPSTPAPPQKAALPAGYRPLNMHCAKSATACTVNCCKSGDLLSPFPECACYFKPPATSKPPGAKPFGMTCAKAKDYCSVNCCMKGHYLSPFPECACYFLPLGVDGGS